MPNVYTIVVLSDGDTWSLSDGCSICVINKEEFMSLCDGFIGVKDLTPLVEIPLNNVKAPL